MRLVWVVIPLVLIGIVGIQESFADFNDYFDRDILEYSQHWIPSLPETQEVKRIYVDDNNELWVLIASKNYEFLEENTKEDLLNHMGTTIHVQTNPTTSYTSPLIFNEKFDEGRFAISMNYLNHRILLTSPYFDKSQLTELGQSMLGWKLRVTDFENEKRNHPYHEMFYGYGLRTGLMAVGPEYSIDLSLLDMAVEQATKNRDHDMFDPLILPKYFQKNLEIKVIEKNPDEYRPYVTLWLAPSNVDFLDFESIEDFYEVGGKIIIQKNPFQLGEHLRPIDGFIVRNSQSTGDKIYNADYEIRMGSIDFDMDAIKMLASMISDEEVYSNLDELSIEGKMREGTVVFSKIGDYSVKPFTNIVTQYLNTQNNDTQNEPNETIQDSRWGKLFLSYPAKINSSEIEITALVDYSYYRDIPKGIVDIINLEISDGLNFQRTSNYPSYEKRNYDSDGIASKVYSFEKSVNQNKQSILKFKITLIEGNENILTITGGKESKTLWLYSNNDNIISIEEKSRTNESLTKIEQEFLTKEIGFIQSPKHQLESGTAPENVYCKEELKLIFKSDNSPACVKPATAEKLIQRGWASS